MKTFVEKPVKLTSQYRWNVVKLTGLSIQIEEPRVKTRGFSDPSGIFIFLLANPAVNRGECARGIQNIFKYNEVARETIHVKKPIFAI